VSLDKALAFIRPWEGGFSDHPRDPGGATNFGITQRTYDRYRRAFSKPTRSVREITQLEVRTIYERYYWLKSKSDQLPASLALVHFDCAVIPGLGAAAKLFQVSVGTKVDGAIGPKTLAKMRAKWRRDPDGLIVEYCARRALRYAGTRNRKTFGLGWMRRLCDCERAALELLN